MKEISILIWRDGRGRTYKITLEGREGQTTTTSAPTQERSEKNITSIGITVENLDRNDLEQFDLSAGIILRSVKRNSPAFKEGLRGGEVIYELDGRSVDSATEFRDYIENRAKGDIVKMQVRSRDSSGGYFDRLVFIQIPKK